MVTNKFEIYDALIDCVSSKALISYTYSGKFWSLCETSDSSGIAMATEGHSISPMLPQGFDGLSLEAAAKAVKSWNLNEASMGMAAINACLNTVAHMESLRCAEPFDNYCTHGLDMSDKTIGVIGHLHMPEYIQRTARDIFIIEREPQAGDYPDAACDFILPQCDFVIITGSTLINKTLPHLLELCENAYTILTGPTVPMSPELLDFGIDRLAGMAIGNRQAIHSHVISGTHGSPYPFGHSWLLKK